MNMSVKITITDLIRTLRNDSYRRVDERVASAQFNEHKQDANQPDRDLPRKDMP